ncbi:MAG TPA: AMP-binding protein, partial [Gemmatimonadales bacterium]|nr:AMP-binding protein [Gemmatimonadales bacterium]
MTDRLDTLLIERRTFRPPAAFTRQATVPSPAVYRQAARNRLRFWEARARELEWMKPWRKALQWNPPHAKWFVGGKLNASVNCLDRHVRTARRNKVALLWEGEPGDRRAITYWELYREVCRFASVLKGLGVKKGDRVAIYLPMIPEAAVAMLACARIGAPHSVVFGGFSAEALRDRINDAEARVLVTADVGYRRGQLVPLKKNADEALEGCPSIRHVVVVRRSSATADPGLAHITEGRDHWYHRLMADAEAECRPAVVDAEDMLFILYTSGTTG